MAVSVAPTALLLLLFGGSWFLPVGLPPLPENPALLRALPRDCLLLVESRGVAEPDAASRNEMERLLAEPEVKEFIQAVMKALENAAREGLQRKSAVLAQELPGLVRNILTRPTVLYVENLQIHAGGPPDISAGLVLDAGPRADAMERSLRALLQQMLNGGDGGPAETVAGARIHRLPLPPQVPPVAWGSREGFLFLGVGNNAADGIARRLAGEEEGGLPAKVREQRSRVKVARPSFLSHIDVAAILEAVPPELRQRFSPILEALGLSSVVSISSVSGLDEKGFATEVFIETRGDLRGILAPFRSRPLDRDSLAEIPGDATLAAVCRLDLEQIYQEILDSVGRIDPRARENAARGILKVESEVGFRFSEDLFQALGDTWRLYSSPSEGGLLVTGLTVVVDVRDEGRLRQTLDRFGSLLQEALATGGRPERGIPPRTIRFGEHTIHYIDLAQNMRRGDFIPLAPAWTFNGGKLVFSLFPQMVKAYLGRGGGREASLDSLPEMQELWEDGRAPVAVKRVDTRAFFRILYPILPPIAAAISGALRQEGIDIPTGLLPSPRALEPHLIPGLAAAYRTDKGILLVQKGGMPLAGGIAPLALPFLGVAKYRSQVRVEEVRAAQSRSRAEEARARARAMDERMRAMEEADRKKAQEGAKSRRRGPRSPAPVR